MMLEHGWTHFASKTRFIFVWHRFKKVLETFLRVSGPYWYNSITQLVVICRLHIHEANLPFPHIPKMLYWIDSVAYLSTANSFSWSNN